MYLTTTRPDILFDVSHLSRFMHCASEMHLKAAKGILRYIRGTVDWEGPNLQVAWILEQWLGWIHWWHEKYIWILFRPRIRGFVLVSKKQEIVAQSTVEAGIIAATTVVNQALWSKKILCDHIWSKRITQIFVDNQVAIAISHNPVFHGKTKHFNVKPFFLRGAKKWRCNSSLLQIRRSVGRLVYKTTSSQQVRVLRKLEFAVLQFLNQGGGLNICSRTQNVYACCP